MVDDGGHQVAQIEYPGLPREHVMEMVHRFYDEYYFRPKAVFRIVRKAVFNGEERKRLYKEAKAFMKLRAARTRPPRRWPRSRRRWKSRAELKSPATNPRRRACAKVRLKSSVTRFAG